jgi:glucose/mannose-6-phosphate isomerase
MKMYDLIEAFPENLSEALNIAKNAKFEKPKNSIKNIVVCGMGGSGIGGKIVSQWLEQDIRLPFTLCQDYSAPSHVNENTLVIASSYSGNTEETLMCVEDSIKSGATIVAITSGGKLEEMAKINSWSHVIVPGGNPPRTALAYSLVQLVNLFVQIGLAPAKRMDEIASAKTLIVNEKESIHALAKEMAMQIGDKTPIFYTSARYEGIGVRAKQQFNENAKKLCWTQVIPEMNHNELVGWGGGNETHAPVFLHPGDLIERNKRRWEISKEKTKSKSSTLVEINAKGNSQIERSLYLISIIDWASWYHADMNNVDSIEIEIIDYLKGELSKM